MGNFLSHTSPILAAATSAKPGGPCPCGCYTCTACSTKLILLYLSPAATHTPFHTLLHTFCPHPPTAPTSATPSCPPSSACYTHACTFCAAQLVLSLGPAATRTPFHTFLHTFVHTHLQQPSQQHQVAPLTGHVRRGVAAAVLHIRCCTSPVPSTSALAVHVPQ